MSNVPVKDQSDNPVAPMCDECGEPREYRFFAYCKACQFRMDLAVKTARKIIRSAKRNGNPVISVNDGGELITGKERDLLEAVHSVDSSTLNFKDGQFAWIVGGNESEADTLADYSGSIEHIIEDANLREEVED